MRWVDDRAWNTGDGPKALFEGARVSDLERLRKAPRPPSGRNMVKSLDRVAEVAGLGVGALGLDAVPHRRVVELAR